MVKAESNKQISKKKCFGTKEWSQNSGICKRCKLQDACGIKAKKINPLIS